MQTTSGDERSLIGSARTLSPALSQILQDTQQHQPLLFREHHGGSSTAAACSREILVISARPFEVSSTRRTRRSSVYFRFTSAFFSSGSTAILIDPGVSHALGQIVFTGNWSLVGQHFENPEIRVAEAGLAQVQTLFRMRRQGVKGLHQHQPDMNPRACLAFSLRPFRILPHHTIGVKYLDINIKV
jgi:hypothetical protein